MRFTRTYAILAAIFVLALALRVGWLAETDSELLPLSDPQYYHATAQNIADGRGYSVGLIDGQFIAGPESEGTAFWPPGYPFAIAPLYRLFDADIRWAKGLNAVAGALTVLPVFYLAMRLRDERTGLLAAGAFALAPAMVFWTASLFSEPLFTLGIASTLACALWASERGTLPPLLATGVLLAATAFVRSQGLLMVVPIGVLLLREFSLAHVVRVGAPVLGMVALFVIPWAIRNEAVMGRPYLINDNLGYNLRLAHGPYSKGTSVPPQDLWDEQPGLTFKQREILFDDLGRERAWAYAREHPGREVELAFRRVSYLLRSDSEASVQWSESLGRTPLAESRRGVYVLLGDLYWYALLMLTVASAFALPRTRLWLALWSALGIWVLLHTVFAGEPRYHAGLVPVMCVLAAAVIVRAWTTTFTTDGAEAAASA